VDDDASTAQFQRILERAQGAAAAWRRKEAARALSREKVEVSRELIRSSEELVSRPRENLGRRSGSLSRD
jgi:hypothetical protein